VALGGEDVQLRKWPIRNCLLGDIPRVSKARANRFSHRRTLAPTAASKEAESVFAKLTQRIISTYLVAGSDGSTIAASDFRLQKRHDALEWLESERGRYRGTEIGLVVDVVEYTTAICVFEVLDAADIQPGRADLSLPRSRQPDPVAPA